MDVEDRFWSKVDRAGGPDTCWPWLGARWSNGYGHFSITRSGKVTDSGAHRVAYRLAVGPIPPGFNVLHRCDNRPCVNPAHLWLGTQSENILDMVAKGRNPNQKGANGSRARLTQEQVDELRRRYVRWSPTDSYSALAREFGLYRGTVRDIVIGKTWTESFGGPKIVPSRARWNGVGE